jgi:hypothetical protein
VDEDAAAFECVVKHLEYPMFVVSAAADGDADACLVGFTNQCSLGAQEALDIEAGRPVS